MASTPVTAPSQQPPPTPPESKSPPPESKAPPPEANSPPPEVKSPPPEAKSPPPKASGPPPPSTTSPPPPSTTSPPQQPKPQPEPEPEPEPTPKPSSPPPTPLPTPSAPTAGNTTPRTPPPPSQNAVPSPPTPTNNNPISLPPPSQPKQTPSSGELSPPPPHAPAHRTPSSSSTSSNDRNSLSPESDSITEKLPLIVGVAVGAGMLCVIMILVYVVCSKKKKKSGSHDQVQYYGDPRNGPKGYYDNGTEQQQNWYNNNNPQMMNQSPQGFMGPPGGGWPQPHQSPTPQLSSGEMSSDPHHASIPQSPGGNMGFSKSTFTYDELAAATNGFVQANLLGQGGFGYVHKGILPSGKVVAVKSLKSGSGQGEREFQAEVEIISRVHHRHLVSLVGYCIAGAQRMLVYEFVPNGTLEYHLYGKDCPTMEWHKRLTIALGSAKGLAYLHEDCHPRIIHRDIKAANILIDNNFEAMVADFGLAKLSQDNITHVSTRVMGTFGYLAPEYASSGKLSEKSDVFSFGVMLLELITGRKPVDTTNSYMDDSLVDWARPIMTQALSDGNFDELVDPLLNNIYNVNEMERMIACAAASIRHSSRRRPKMSQIVRALEGDASLEALNEGGVLPGQSSAFASSSDSYDTTAYNADLKKFRKMALGTSTECSGVTSSYGLNPSSSSDSSYSGEVNHPGNTHPKN